MIQLNLFDPTVIKQAHLNADSPRQAFYRIWIELFQGTYTVCRESGCKKRINDRRAYEYQTLVEAEKIFNRYLKAKSNPQRKSPRKYKLVEKKYHSPAISKIL